MTADHKNPNGRMSRRAIREAVFKLLFISEFNSDEEMKRQVEIYFDGAGSENDDKVSDVIPDGEDVQFINDRYEKVKACVGEIDELLNKTAEGWKTSRMSKVDLCVLRLAVYEMIYDDSIPLSVAINEAVEIAKKFGGETSGSFINGILGKIAKENKE